jgi:preprotein translocase subunit SecF
LFLHVPKIYESRHYKKLFLIPVALIIASLFLVFVSPGVKSGIDLRGGLLVTVHSDEAVNVPALKAALAARYPDADVAPFENPTGRGVEIQLPVDESLAAAEESLKRVHELDVNLTRVEVELAWWQQNASNASALAAAEARAGAARAALLTEAGRVLAASRSTKAVPTDAHEAAKLADEEFSRAQQAYRDDLVAAISGVVRVKSLSFKEIGASLSKFFVSKTQEVVAWAFALSAIIIFFIFRSAAPSLAVIFGAFSDITITLGAMALFGIPLTLASIAALLMLIGFSLDTDVLLTVRIMKRKEDSPPQRAFQAMRIAVMMNLCTMASFGVLAVIGAWLQIPTYTQIGLVAFIGGGVVDFVATWFTNAPLVLWFVERKEKKMLSVQ